MSRTGDAAPAGAEVRRRRENGNVLRLSSEYMNRCSGSGLRLRHGGNEQRRGPPSRRRCARRKNARQDCFEVRA